MLSKLKGCYERDTYQNCDGFDINHRGPYSQHVFLHNLQIGPISQGVLIGRTLSEVLCNTLAYQVYS
jgi:hypothetical protein